MPVADDSSDEKLKTILFELSSGKWHRTDDVMHPIGGGALEMQFVLYSIVGLSLISILCKV